jgi:hypothetical protein
VASRPELVDPALIPREFDRLVEWLDEWSEGLVLLAEYPVLDLRHAVDGVRRAVNAHGRAFARRLAPVDPDPAREPARAILRSDHVWFATSLDQFDWFLRVVEREDHGGHRQALGQYGRLIAEALRRHRRLERDALGPDPGVRDRARG